jgi:uncharacterized membrane protein (DUF2068 family)
MAMNDRAPQAKPPHEKPPLGFMAWIAGYKLFKALLAFSAALFMFHLLHKDLAKVAMELVEFFGLNQQSRLAEHIVSRVGRLTPNRIHFIAVVLLIYTAIYITEGVGLFMEQRWAEWLTVVQTGLLVPWEIIEIVRHRTWVRIGVLALNIAVVIYLLWRIRRDVRVEHREEGEPGAA